MREGKTTPLLFGSAGEFNIEEIVGKEGMTNNLTRKRGRVEKEKNGLRVLDLEISELRRKSLGENPIPQTQHRTKTSKTFCAKEKRKKKKSSRGNYISRVQRRGGVGSEGSNKRPCDEGTKRKKMKNLIFALRGEWECVPGEGSLRVSRRRF